MKLFSDTPDWRMVVTNEVEEFIIPPFAYVVGTGIVVHGGIIHIPKVRGKHRWNVAHSQRCQGVTGHDNWLLRQSKGATNVSTIKVRTWATPRLQMYLEEWQFWGIYLIRSSTSSWGKKARASIMPQNKRNSALVLYCVPKPSSWILHQVDCVRWYKQPLLSTSSILYFLLFYFPFIFVFFLKKDAETVLTLPCFIFFSVTLFPCLFYLWLFYLDSIFHVLVQTKIDLGPYENNFVFHSIGRRTHFKVKYRSFHDLVVITKGKQK